MKREDLKAMGLTDEQVDKVMAENGKDVEAEKVRTAAETAKFKTAEQTAKDLQETVKKFDGVDVQKLKGDLATAQAKYDTDIAAERTKADNLQKEYGLKDALKAAGVMDPDYLIFKHGGVEKFAFGTDGKAIGIDDITKPYRESSPHLFAESKPAAPAKTGMRQAGTEMVNEKKDEANNAFRSLFGKE